MTSMEEFGVAAFQRSLGQRKLMGSRCQRCGALYLPPRALCPKCQGKEMGWQELSGKGRLAGFTSINVVPTFMQQEGYGRDNPYLTGIVALDEGPRIAARLVGMDPLKPEHIKIGTRLAVAFQEEEKNGQRHVTLAFRPAARRSGRS